MVIRQAQIYLVYYETILFTGPYRNELKEKALASPRNTRYNYLGCCAIQKGDFLCNPVCDNSLERN